MRCCLPSLRPAAFPPLSPPPIAVGFVRCFNGTMQPSDSSSVPRQLCLLDFLSRPGIAQATAGQTRSPRFRPDPSVRDMASDPGRATVPRITAPHMLPSAIATASAPAISRISWPNPTPHTITVYASPCSSPPTTQHSLPGGCYPFPGPDFHRLDRASFAWRTARPSLEEARTLYSLPVSRRTHCQLNQGWCASSIGGAVARCEEVFGTPIELPPLNLEEAEEHEQLAEERRYRAWSPLLLFFGLGPVAFFRH